MVKKGEFVFVRTKTRPKSVLTKPEILDDLKRLGKELRRSTFTIKEYDKWKRRRMNSKTVVTRFGSWAAAMKAAGLKPARVGRRDLGAMVETFKACWIQLKQEPTAKEFKEYLKDVYSPYTWKSYIHAFGSLGRLAQRIVDHQGGKISERQLYEPYKPERRRNPIPLKLRYRVLKRDRDRCVKCGASPLTDKSIRLQVDHIIPESKGGLTSLENLQTLCEACNQGKKDRED